MRNSKISIIIPCHNSAAFLDRPWHSLLAQTIGMENLQIIFVDDASDDFDNADSTAPAGISRTWAKLLEYERQFPDSVAILHLEENMRQGGARNAALPYVTGKYLMFLDSDDALTPDACRMLYDKAEAYQADLVEFSYTWVLDRKEQQNGLVCQDQNLHEKEELLIIGNAEDRRKLLIPGIVNYGCVNKLYRMDLVRKTGARFTEHVINQEPPFVYPQFLYAERVLLLPDHLYRYYIHSNSTTTGRLGVKVLQHADVQLRLLRYLINRPEEFRLYHAEIEFYIIWSAYIEILDMASRREDAFLPSDGLRAVQETLLQCFPDFENNSYIRRLDFPVRILVGTLRIPAEGEEDVRTRIAEAKRVL